MGLGTLAARDGVGTAGLKAKLAFMPALRGARPRGPGAGAASQDGAIAEDWLGKVGDELDADQRLDAEIPRVGAKFPEGDVPAPVASAASRHFVALSAARMKEWMGADLSGLSILTAVQIDGIHISEHLVLVAALGIDSEGLSTASG